MIISNGGIATSQILIIEFQTLTNVDSSMTNKINALRTKANLKPL